MVEKSAMVIEFSYPPPPQTLLSLALAACLLPLLPILIWKQEAARIAEIVGIPFVCHVFFQMWGVVGGCWKLEILRWNLSVRRSHVTILVQTDTVVQPQRWFGSKLIWPVSVWFCRFVCMVEEFLESKNGKYHLQYLFNQVWPDSQHLMINQITMNTDGDKRQDYFLFLWKRKALSYFAADIWKWKHCKIPRFAVLSPCPWEKR